ncbi:MAG: DNA alkylation repair protein [Acidimicrobiia bacterium]
MPEPATASPAALVESITSALRNAGDPTRAEQERRYLKSDRTFAGCSVPACRRIVRAATKQHSPLTHDELIATVDLLWNGPFFETRRAAVEIAVTHARLLTHHDLPWLHDLITHGETWAIVDELAARVLGSIFDHDPTNTAPVLATWATDPAFWVRRSVLLAHLLGLRSGNGDWPSFTHYAETMLDEKEFFIRKAIGWVLRETSKKRPELVRDWVTPRLDRMSGVTRREATRYL